MLSKDEFVRRILDGAPREAKPAPDTGFGDAMLEGFDGFDVSNEAEESTTDARFAQLLLEESGFGRGETLPRGEVVLGDQKTNRFLPHGATYWTKTTERPFHILLFDLESKGSAILDDGFFRQNDQLEDALHRIVQDALEGFERGGEGRTADRKKGAQTETLCVVSVIDDRRDGPERQIVCFGTKCTATDALEVFTLREEARDWDRPLAEEHLGQLFERHFKRLGTGARWQDAFVSGEERKKARKLMDECAGLLPDEKQLQAAIRELLDEIAGSFGLRRKGGRGGHRLVMHALPEDHSIAVDPEDARKKGFKNPFQGLRIFDADERLIGYIVYVLDNKSEAERLHRQLAQHNHFHNVLVVYPEKAGATLELWQGTEPLRGRLISGARRSRFDGEGGVVQLLSRFFVVSRSEIRTPQHLARELAWRAQHLKALAVDELAKEEPRPKGQRPLRDLYEVFYKALASLDEAEFADAYAQTITYGLLAARWLSSNRADVRFARKNIEELLPSTSGFLHDLFQRLVNSRFDQNLAWLLDDVTSLLSRTMVTEVFQGERDPVIHFYEDFLDAYDPKIREERGVYYTPDAVVSYIVRNVDDALRKNFGLQLGLADTTTWKQFANEHKCNIPEGVDPQSPFVQILDPALGTGTFLMHVIEVIRETMEAKWSQDGYAKNDFAKRWSEYVRRSLLPRLAGFEVMMAPYVVAHLRLGLLLEESGFSFGSQDRLPIFLTNTLEPSSEPQLEMLGEHVAEEARLAQSIKNVRPVTIVLGNPPYSGHSSNEGAWSRELVSTYRKIGDRHLRLAQGKWLQNDYVKFIAYAEHRIMATGSGVLGYITDHSYLDGDTFPGLRHHLLSSFSEVHALDLHGNLKRRESPPGGGIDENVFDIQQGVAIIVASRRPHQDGLGTLYVADLWGERCHKLTKLRSLKSDIEWKRRERFGDTFLFVRRGASQSLDEEFTRYDAVDGIFSPNGRPAPGFLTTHDSFAIAFTPDELVRNVDIVVKSSSEEEARDAVKLCSQDQWSYERAKSELASGQWKSLLRECLYRPFDNRWTAYDTNVLVHRRERVSQHLLGTGNLALLTTRMTKGDDFRHVFVSDKITEVICLSSKTSANAFVFPLYLEETNQLLPGSGKKVNIAAEVLAAYENLLGTRPKPEALFGYIYAVLNSRAYRKRYNGLLVRNFPRIPRPKSVEPILFTAKSSRWEERGPLGGCTRI